MTGPDLSIVIPLHDEEENIPFLVEEIRSALGSRNWELILVDDGSRDGTLATACRAAGADDRIRVLRLARNYGQSTALQAGFDHARGAAIVSLDGDLQNDPGEILLLLERLEEGSDVVVGYRAHRYRNEPLRAIPSWLANRIIRAWTGVRIRDTGCTLKAFRRGVLERLYLYSDFHRFIPAVAVARAGARISEQRVTHHPRLHGVSKYGLGRTPAVLSDLLILRMLLRSPDQPLRIFTRWSLLWFAFASLLALGAWISGMWLPLFHPLALVLPGAVMLLVALGVWLLMLGLIAEVFLFMRRGGFSMGRQDAEEVT